MLLVMVDPAVAPMIVPDEGDRRLSGPEVVNVLSGGVEPFCAIHILTHIS
jgi:hypothetical protein